MTNDQVQEALIRWLRQVTGITVIKAHQGVDRPELPYLMIEQGTVDELSQHPEQFHYSENDDSQIEVTPVLELEWLMLLFSFGESGSNALRKIKQAVHLTQVQEPLMPVLNIHETGVINNIPEFVDNRWEPRSQMNIMVRGVTTSTDGFVIDTIEEHTPFDVEVT